jgi:hypothetical protein
MERKPSAFASFDVELNGQNPLQHSMLSIGVALFVEHVGLVDRFYRNIKARPGTTCDQKTMENFWRLHPAQWEKVNTNQVTHEEAMSELSKWIAIHSKTYRLKWVAKPSCVDWMWLKCYYDTYGPEDKLDLGHYCDCLGTMLKTYFFLYPSRDKKDCVAKLANHLPYTHDALEDAIYQGTIYMNLRKIFHTTKYQ